MKNTHLRALQPARSRTGLSTIKWIRMLLSLCGALATGTVVGTATVTTTGLAVAAASTHLGILGQIAPELHLHTWIDGDGREMAPVRLNDFRGKVIYLYFFQDW